MSALVGPDTLILTQPEVRRLAIRLLVLRNRLIAEGAGAAPVAAAMAGQAGRVPKRRLRGGLAGPRRFSWHREPSLGKVEESR